MSKKLNLDKNLIIQKYVDEDKSLKQVAKEVGCGRTALSRYLKKYNIEKRDRYALHKKIFNGTDNPFYGKLHSNKTRNIISSTMIESGTTKGTNNPAFKYAISKKFLINEYIKNNKTTGQIAKELGCHICTILRDLKSYNISLKPQNIEKKEIFKGQKNPNWKGGLSFLPYPAEFNKDLKYKIRKRDNFTCQLCAITEEEHLIVYGCNLHTHHIDYNKSNCGEDNLTALCNGCNARVNFNRGYWTSFFKNKMRVN